MTTVADNIKQIFAIIDDIAKDEPGIANILFEHTGLAVSVIQQIAAGNNVTDTTEQKMALVASIFGFSLEEVIEEAITSRAEETINKAPDEETLSFITAQEDVDDYERFLKENNVQENLIALAQEI